VAAGIAETYGIDVILVRVLWVLAAIAGFGIPLYVIAWIALPSETGGGLTGGERTREVSLVLGLALIALGVFVAFDRAWPGRPHIGAITWPLFLILGGVAILLVRRARDADTPPEISPDRTYGERPEPGAEPATTSTSPDAPPTDEAPPGPDTLPTVPATAAAAGAGAPPEPPTTAWTQRAPWPATSRPPRPRRAREQPFLTPLTLSVLLIGAGVVALLDALDVIEVEPSIVLASALGLVALVLILAAWVGRARFLIFVGIVLTVFAIGTAILDVPLGGGWGDRTYEPTSRAEIRSPYELSGGQLRLDLRDVSFAGAVTRVDASVGFGQLLVDVPAGVRVVVHARVSAGNVDLFGHTEDGLHIDTEQRVAGTGQGSLRLDLRVGAGEIVVRRFDRTRTEILTELRVPPVVVGSAA
jgi:hypothetical protein